MEPHHFAPELDSARSSRQQRKAGLDRFFKALSDETRREILQLLTRQDYSVGEIVSNFDLSQPTISRHLSVLKQANLVSDRRRGQHVIYRLNEEIINASARSFFDRFGHS
jgi:DNA-binding transcriptional ArsR family regulator